MYDNKMHILILMTNVHVLRPCEGEQVPPCYSAPTQCKIATMDLRFGLVVFLAIWKKLKFLHFYDFECHRDFSRLKVGRNSIQNAK